MCPDHMNQSRSTVAKRPSTTSNKRPWQSKRWRGKPIQTYTLEGIQKEKKTRKMSLIDVRTPKKHITITAAIKRGNMKVSTLTK